MPAAIVIATAEERAERERSAEGRAGYGARLHALMRARAAHALLIGAIAGTLDFLRVLPLLSAAGGPVLAVLAAILCINVMQAALVVCGASLAQALPIAGWRRAALMVAGAWSGVLVGGTALVALSLYTSLNLTLSAGIVSSLASNVMYVGWEFSAIGTAIALYYAARAHEAELAERARQAELERLGVEHTMMESRLAVLRARVEPEFLFGALDEVRALYRRDRVMADEMIDALITYLRAALPQMRGEASTVGREIDLVRAYVGVLQVPRGAALALDAWVAGDVRDAALPPMVLLPLAQATFASGATDLRRRFRIDARAARGEILITIEIEGGARPDAWRSDGPETPRRTLKSYFGTGARLEFVSDGATHRAEVHLLDADHALVGARAA